MKKYLMYRYNSFLKDEGSTSLIRVHNKEYRIKKEIFTYEELLNCIMYFKDFRDVEIIEEYTLQSKIVRFLIHIGVLNLSKVSYPNAKILRYLIKNYKDFNQIMNKVANSAIDIKVISHECDNLYRFFENKIQMYLGDFSSDNLTRKIQIIVVNQVANLDKIKRELAYTNADNYILVAYNANKEAWIYSTKEKSEIFQILNHFMVYSSEKVIFSDTFYTVTANYVILMLMDSLSNYRKLFNTYCINKSLEVKNKCFYGLNIGRDSFMKIEEKHLRIDESLAEEESLNRFIVKSREVIDIDFEYKFMNVGDINKVITVVRDKDVIESEGVGELLFNAVKQSVSKAIIKLFQNYGIKVSLAFGFTEIKKLFTSNRSLYVFDDQGLFSKEGVLIYKVD